MRIHILGICGTFMGGIARLARDMGHAVSGSDAGVYPPMSTQLEAAGIRLDEGYLPEHLEPAPDLVLIGNALSRGNPAVEYVLDKGIPYTSGPAWLADRVLPGRWVLAVAGTHGKTTTASLLAWILEHAGLEPGFLIGGVPGNFGVSARTGSAGGPFVIEADEYDTAFFDKRPKFIHYRPKTLVINNIEFDHADIFPDLAAIELQFHHLVRTVPGNGRIIAPHDEDCTGRVLEKGCWTPVETFGADGAHWQATADAPDFTRFNLHAPGTVPLRVEWGQLGRHNADNATAAAAAAAHAGVDAGISAAALAGFAGVRRRLEKIAEIDGICLYDDFAHHPSAIRASVSSLRRHAGKGRIICVMEPRSNTMRLGVHRDTLGPAFADADISLFFQPPDIDWPLEEAVARAPQGSLFEDIDSLVRHITGIAGPGDHVLIMSNGGFGGIHHRLAQSLQDARLQKTV